MKLFLSAFLLTAASFGVGTTLATDCVHRAIIVRDGGGGKYHVDFGNTLSCDIDPDQDRCSATQTVVGSCEEADTLELTLTFPVDGSMKKVGRLTYRLNGEKKGENSCFKDWVGDNQCGGGGLGGCGSQLSLSYKAIKFYLGMTHSFRIKNNGNLEVNCCTDGKSWCSSTAKIVDDSNTGGSYKVDFKNNNGDLLGSCNMNQASHQCTAIFCASSCDVRKWDLERTDAGSSTSEVHQFKAWGDGTDTTNEDCFYNGNNVCTGGTSCYYYGSPVEGKEKLKFQEQGDKHQIIKNLAAGDTHPRWFVNCDV